MNATADKAVSGLRKRIEGYLSMWGQYDGDYPDKVAPGPVLRNSYGGQYAIELRAGDKTVKVCVEPLSGAILFDGGRYRDGAEVAFVLADQHEMDENKAFLLGVSADMAVSKVRDQAEQDDPTVRIRVGHDSSNVWYVCVATYEATGRPVRKPRDEGGTLPNFKLARMEAERVAARATGNIIREGW